MLVLSRKLGQSITIAGQIVVTIVRVGRGNVQIGIEAPSDVPILRQEIVDRALAVQLAEAADLFMPTG